MYMQVLYALTQVSHSFQLAWYYVVANDALKFMSKFRCFCIESYDSARIKLLYFTFSRHVVPNMIMAFSVVSILVQQAHKKYYLHMLKAAYTITSIDFYV
jgi:hypothetical protein